MPDERDKKQLTDAELGNERRSILKSAAAAMAVMLATGKVALGKEKKAQGTAGMPQPLTLSGEKALYEDSPASADPLIRMQKEIKRALKKHVSERKWVMVIDLRKCVGCHACTISCVAENKLPPGTVYRPVLEEEIGTFPNVTRRFTPRPCMQCDKPPCVDVCPVSATWKRPDGIVTIDYNQCIGCRYCITACPYSARVFDTGHKYTEDSPEDANALVSADNAQVYEDAPPFEYGQEWPRTKNRSPIGNARKCHFCVHRIERGLLPECVTTCMGRSTYFGDANDPDSLVSELIAKPNVTRLKEEMGTEPSVYYLL